MVCVCVCVFVWDAARWNRKQWDGGASWCHEPIQEVPGHNNGDEDSVTGRTYTSQ